MKSVLRRLLHILDRDVSEREVEEELRFHLDRLTEHNREQQMSIAEARDAARKRFGDLEHIKEQCLEISKNKRLGIRLMKSFLVLVFLAGVLIRVFSPELHLTRVGDVLIMVAILGKLFFYVRGLKPAQFTPKPEDSSALVLNPKGPTSFVIYDERKRTPLERIISDS